MAWEKKPPLKGEDIHVGCLNCSTAAKKAPMNMLIAVGFGSALVFRDNEIFYDGESDYQKTGKCKSLQDIENEAKNDPDHDWCLEKYGPLHGETFQRQGDEEWVCIESNPGFA